MSFVKISGHERTHGFRESPDGPGRTEDRRGAGGVLLRRGPIVRVRIDDPHRDKTAAVGATASLPWLLHRRRRDAVLTGSCRFGHRNLPVGLRPTVCVRVTGRTVADPPPIGESQTAGRPERALLRALASGPGR